MKKLTLIFVAIGLCLSLIGCGSAEPEGRPAPSMPTTSTPTTSTPATSTPATKPAAPVKN